MAIRSGFKGISRVEDAKRDQCNPNNAITVGAIIRIDAVMRDAGLTNKEFCKRLECSNGTFLLDKAGTAPYHISSCASPNDASR